jgi:SAM-dependent methyltransferase
MSILDAGCGLDAPILSEHANRCKLALGVDLVDVFQAPDTVKVLRADLSALPVGDGTFDLIFSRSVLEHLPSPSQTFQELSRVLKTGGNIILVTPNKYDYASLMARLIPNRFHRTFLRSTAGEEVYDNFPTFFRCNTRRAFVKAVRGTDLVLKKIQYLRHYPYYLMFSVPLFYLGVAYDRLITRLGLHLLQPTIYVELEKRAP